MRTAGLVFGLACCAAAICCAHAPRETYSATFTDRAIRIESYAKSFRTAEPSLIMGLVGETRLFGRMTPHVNAVGGGPWISRAFVDPFMFADRQTALERARMGFEQVALPADAALQVELLRSRVAGTSLGQDALLAQVRLEQNTFRRMLDAEDARLERERTLPRGAADLVRTFTLEWPLAPRAGAMHDIESMVAWRLVNVQESLGPNTLSEAEREDLRSALAELAPHVAQLPRAAAAMVKLRLALDAMWVTPYALEDETSMDKQLSLFVGAPMSFDALDDSLEQAARAFEVQASAGLSVLGAPDRARVMVRAKELLLATPSCTPRVPVHTPLDLAPPDERTWACAILHAFDDAHTDLDELAANLAWHDATVVARWAVSTHGPVRATDAAKRRAALVLPLSNAESDRLMLLARARPLRAMGAGVAAVIVMKKGAAHARARAHHWRGIGDAPMDLIDDML